MKQTAASPLLSDEDALWLRSRGSRRTAENRDVCVTDTLENEAEEDLIIYF